MTNVAVLRRLSGVERPLRVALGIALVAYVAGYLVWLAAPFGSEEQQAFFTNFAFLPVDGVVIVLWAAAARRSGAGSPSRLAWALLAGAMVAMAFGDAVYFWLDVTGEVPFPSIADVGYLVFYALMLVGLLRFPTAARTRDESARFWLDAALIVVAGGMFVWEFVLHAALTTDGLDPLAAALSVGYPVGDLLLLLGISVTVLRRQETSNRRSLAVIALGALLFFGADTGFAIASAEGSHLGGSWPDGLFMLATLAWAAAGWVALRDARLPAGTGLAIRVGGVSPFPYVAVGAAYVLIVALTWSPNDRSGQLVLGGAALTALVVARQIVAVRDNIRLTRVQAQHDVEERFLGLIQHASDVITVIDDDLTIRYQTPSISGLLGYDAAALIGTSIADIVHPRDALALAALADVTDERGRPSAPIELRLRDTSGGWRETEAIAADLRAIPSVRGLVLTTRDVTEQKALTARLKDQSLHDPLTGLANRLLFHDRVEQALRRSVRRGVKTAVLFMDLDEFKRINDTRGHEAGDQLLVAVAARLAGAVRREDTPARLGGDEFAVLIEDVTDVASALHEAQRICELLAAPIQVQAIATVATASIGVAMASPGHEDADELMRNADVAMYAAKSAGRNRVIAYEPFMHAKLVDRVALEADLRAAVAADEITFQMQPLFEVAGGRIVGAEVLARWTHQARGMVPPATFIPVAEQTGLIVEIGRRVLVDACREAAQWAAIAGGPPMSVNVNVSSVQLDDPGLTRDVRHALAASGLSPELLTLEITESVLATDSPEVHEALDALKALGVRLSIDDFGTGYSSLSYLHTFPFDEVKIDRSFVSRLRPDAREDHVFVRAIIELARGLGLIVIAEGIETADQLQVLQSLGCQLGQGYVVARPMDPAALRTFIARQTLRPARSGAVPDVLTPRTVVRIQSAGPEFADLPGH